jgi:hypothetical protein
MITLKRYTVLYICSKKEEDEHLIYLLRYVFGEKLMVHYSIWIIGDIQNNKTGNSQLLCESNKIMLSCKEDPSFLSFSFKSIITPKTLRL